MHSKAQSVEHIYGGLRHIRWSRPTVAIIYINFGDVMYVLEGRDGGTEHETGNM